MGSAAGTSVRASVIVDAPIERAFHVFTAEFGGFKPREHNLLQTEIAETIFEPRVGGHIYDRGVDGSECRWARVLAFEPPHRVVFSWDIAPPGRSRPTRAGPVRWRSASSRSHPTGRESTWSIVISIVTARAGSPSGTASVPRAAGRCT